MDSNSDSEVDCAEAVHVIYHYLDGELTNERRVHIQAHLEACLPCFEAYDFEAELKMVIAKKCIDEVPADLKQRIIQALERESGLM